MNYQVPDYIVQQAIAILRFSVIENPIPDDVSHGYWVDKVVVFLADYYDYKSPARIEFVNGLRELLDNYVLENWSKGWFNAKVTAHA